MLSLAFADGISSIVFRFYTWVFVGLLFGINGGVFCRFSSGVRVPLFVLHGVCEVGDVVWQRKKTKQNKKSKI